MLRFSSVAILLFCLLSASSLTAQETSFGVRAGLNIANQVFGDETTDDRTAGSFGLYINQQLGKVVSFQVEALYTGKGATGSFLGVEYTSKFDYIEVPLLLRIGPNVGEVHLFIESGITPGVLVSSGVSANGDSFYGDSEEFESFELSVPLGAGIEVNTEKVQLQFDVRYNIGLTDVAKEVAPGFDNFKNRGLMIMAGVGFRF